MPQNQALYVKTNRVYPRRVFFTGSTALVRGQGLCYDRDYGTAATAEARRDRMVELPSRTNNMWFAGVTAAAYVAKTGGQYIVVYEPGSTCMVQTGLVTTVASTLLTCSCSPADTGIFTLGGKVGRGSALALQDAASAATGNVPVSASWDGSAVIGAGDKVLTKTALFTNAVVGDTVVVVGGSVTADGSAVVTDAEYTIATRSSADEVILDTSPCAAASSVACYVKRGDPEVLALLLDGPESGLQQVVAPIVSAETDPVIMAGGTTFVCGGPTLAGATVLTLADGTQIVDEKVVKQLGTLTTNGAAITSSNMRKATYALTATFTLLAANDYALLRWAGGSWSVIGGDGTAA